jgi:hypothetical protein
MKRINSVFGLFILIIIASCAVITEPDLTDSEVELYSPADSTLTPTQTHTFWWGYVNDAEKYNLLIVSPHFDSVASLIADTNLTDNKYVGTLFPGKYQWGVSAYNHSSATPYTIFNLEIDTLDGIAYQTVRLSSPRENDALNTAEIEFTWEALNGATFYLFDVRDSTWSLAQSIDRTNLTGTSYSVTLSEGYYSWGVSAYDDVSGTNTNWSVRNFLIDMTPPGRPTITNPAFNGDTLDTSPYTIEWTHPDPSVSAISDSIMISADSLFTEGSEIEIDVINSPEYSVSHKEDGKYFVKVKSFDEAGNQGDYSAIRRFFLNKEE